MKKNILDISAGKRRAGQRSFILNTLFVVGVLCFLGSVNLNGQEQFQEKYEKVFENKTGLKINHRNGPIEIIPSPDGKVRVTTEISMKAESSKDAQVVFDHFKLESEEVGSRCSVNTSVKIKRWQSNNDRIRIEFEDGQKVQNIRDLTIKMVVYVPKLKDLKVSNRYGDIKLSEDTYQDLNIQLYNGNLDIPEVLEGELVLELKYSKANIGDVNVAKYELYDSKLFMGDGEQVDLYTKYSKFELGDVEVLSIESYDDDFEMGDVVRLSIKDKYSEFDIKDFKDGRMDIYDSTLSLGDGTTLKLKSKYSKMVIGDLKYLDCELSYDDKITIGTLERFVANSKYTDFRIGQLKSKFVLESYDDNLNIGWITGPIEEISFNGKYTDLTMNLPEDEKYILEAKTQYGKFNYPKSKVEHSYLNMDGDRLELKGKVIGSTEDSPKIKIQSYDGKITLNY